MHIRTEKKVAKLDQWQLAIGSRLRHLTTFREATWIFYSAFLTVLRRFGAVVMDSLFFSISAAHSAAPTKLDQHSVMRLICRD